MSAHVTGVDLRWAAVFVVKPGEVLEAGDDQEPLDEGHFELVIGDGDDFAVFGGSLDDLRALAGKINSALGQLSNG